MKQKQIGNHTLILCPYCKQIITLEAGTSNFIIEENEKPSKSEVSHA